MRVRLQSFPPLGQVTSTCSPDVHFKVVIDAPRSWKNESWEICIWYSVDEQPWQGLPLSELQAHHQPVSLQLPSTSVSQRYFGTKIPFDRNIKFTFKFRHTSHPDWIWVREEYGFDDGHVLSQSPSASAQSSKLTDIIPDLNSAWTVSPLLSQAPQTSLWSLKATVSGAKDDEPSSKELHIGTPWGGFLRYDPYIWPLLKRCRSVC